MRTFRFKANEGQDTYLSINFTPPAGTLQARVIATNSSGSSTTLSSAVTINGSKFDVTIPASYVVYSNFPAKFEVQLKVDSGNWYTDVEAYGYIVTAAVPPSQVIGDVSTADSVIQSLLSNPTSGTKTALTTLVETAADDAVEQAVETHTPGIELASSSRTSNFTTTNTVNTNAAGNITSVSITVVGNGRPVDLRFHCPSVYHTVANTVISAVIMTDNNLLNTNNQIGATVSPLTTSGPSMTIVRRTAALVQGQSYTFTARTWASAAGTTTFVGATYCPIQLTATST